MEKKLENPAIVEELSCDESARIIGGGEPQSYFIGGGAITESQQLALSVATGNLWKGAIYHLPS